MAAHIRQTEWVTDQAGNGWFNGYYDNHDRQVEGAGEKVVRMMLTGQVFAIRRHCRFGTDPQYCKKRGHLPV